MDQETSGMQMAIDAVAGKSEEEIRDLLSMSVHSEAIRDLDGLAAYIAMLANPSE